MDFSSSVVSLPALIAEHAARSADALFLLWRGQSMSYAECAEVTSRAAAGLHQRGVRPGDRVMTLLSSRRDTVLALLTVSIAQGILAPANRWLRHGPLRSILQYLRPHWVIADKDLIAVLHRHAEFLPPQTRWIVAPGGARDSLWADLAAGRNSLPVPDAAPDDTCYLDFTSGSRGHPKGVMRTHRSILAISAGAVKALGIRPTDRHLSLFAPFAHPHETVGRAAMVGGAVALVDALRPTAVADAVHRLGVTCVMAVPTVYGLLARALPGDPRLAGVRLFEAGGAVTPESLIDTFVAQWGTPITPVWGCTETAGIALAGVPAEARPARSAGRLCPGFRARILGEDGASISGGEPGELALAGPSLFSEYYLLPEETRRVVRDGWYHSGDVFSRDADGWFFFHGRIDEMIKVRGFKVFPSEIEHVLLLHADVAETAVVEGGGEGDERPVAYVVPRHGVDLLPADMRAHCQRHLAPYKVPVVIIRSALPKTRSGKILKRGLVR